LFLGLNVGSFIAPAAMAQDRRSDSDNGRSDRDSSRRGGWSSWRRDREERRSERSNESQDAKADKSDSKSDNSPGISNETVAKGLIDKFDANKNKVLDGDELSNLREPARSADFNKDGVIDRNELVSRFANPSAKGAAPPAASASASADGMANAAADRDKKDEKSESRGGFFGIGGGERGGRSDKEKSTEGAKSGSPAKRVFTWTGGATPGDDKKPARRTYRFTPAREKLASDLPSWFKSQDKNGDGQVSMSEYSRSWSKSTVAKFQGYDSDKDGIVTAREAKGKK
jgi:Ca2+-binding EF-hand superfamily protein